MTVTVRPAVAVNILEQATPVSVPNDTGTWFVDGTTDRGPANTATLIQSMDQFVTVFGARQSYSVLYDALELFFREGGNRAYVSRVVGPSATIGTHNLLDTNSAVSLTVNAIGPGAWSSGYKVAVVAGSGSNFQIQVSDSSNVVLEQSPDLPDQGSAIAWSRNSNYIRIVLGATALNPVVAALAAISSGNDDRGSITDTEWATALAAFAVTLGPGQVSHPGRATSTAYGQIKTHAEANNRVGLIDLANSGTESTVASSAASVSSRFVAGFAPWAVIPGLTTGTTRTVPPCALIAGLVAKNDPALGTDAPAAGANGQSAYVIDLSQNDWNDTDRTALNTAGANVIRRMFGGIRVYGWRSLTNPVTDASWIDFGNARLYMQLAGEFDAIGENYIFNELNNATINLFHADLAGTLLAHYAAGDLYGDTPDQAFAVDTSATVNTPTTLANNELHAAVRVRMSPFAEWVQIQIVKRQVTQTV